MPDEESISGATVSGTGPQQKNEGKVCHSSGEPRRREGYQKLADLMANYPASAIFCQFGSLNALNLLYYQSELALLQKELRDAAEADRQSPDAVRRVYYRNHEFLSSGYVQDGRLAPEDNKQWQIILRIRKVLKEYSQSD